MNFCKTEAVSYPVIPPLAAGRVLASLRLTLSLPRTPLLGRGEWKFLSGGQQLSVNLTREILRPSLRHLSQKPPRLAIAAYASMTCNLRTPHSIASFPSSNLVRRPRLGTKPAPICSCPPRRASFFRQRPYRVQVHNSSTLALSDVSQLPHLPPCLLLDQALPP